MSITNLFNKLNAPLANSRWSWGSERESDKAIFLRVWQDRKIKHEDSYYIMITHHEKFKGNESNLGYKERNSHVESIRNGAKCYLVMCLAKSVTDEPREIKSFNEKEVFVGGQVIELNGNSWVELIGRSPAKKVVV